VSIVPSFDPAPQSLRLLVLGGTRFVGRAVVNSALERGHEVTLFNRGVTNPGLFGARVEEIRGDRAQDMSQLVGRSWDAVVDVAAYHPADVARAVAAVGDNVRCYLFVSTVSVYADQSVPPVEGAAVAQLSDPEDRGPESYGARKAACERVVRDAVAERATIVRPGLIVGPHDSTDRFSYWPRRTSQGGRILAPGAPGDLLQFIDVRDLAAFIILLLEQDRPGTFNATGNMITFGSFLGTCAQVSGTDSEFVWVPSERLLEAGLDPWMGVPLWICAPGWEAANRVDITLALSAGLTFRPLDQTVQAALVGPPPPALSDFTRERELELLSGRR
jgi:2'-hydroxyisoflavone reductase